MKLRTKLAVALVLVTLVMSGTVYGGLELYKQRLVEDSQVEVDETATLAADQLEASIAERKDFVGFAASRPEAAQFDRSGEFLEEFVDNTRFNAAQLVAANGTVLDFHGDVTREVQQESIGDDVGDRPYVREALDGEVYVSEPQFTVADERPFMIVSAPIYADERVRAVLATSIYIDRSTFFGTLAPISTTDQRVSVRSGSTTLYRSGGGFDDAIVGSSTVPSTGWTVTVARDSGPLLGQIRDLAVAQGIGIFVVMLSAILFGVWEYRTTLEMTERLLEGFRTLREGRFDQDLRLDAAEEWEQISDGFNELAAGLAEREDALRQREQRLQVLNRVIRHNLRHSVNLVTGNADLIRDRTASRGIIRPLARIEAATANLLDLSEKSRQIEATVTGSEGKVPVDIVQIVRDVLESLETDYPAIELESTLPEEAWVDADPAIRIAIENVCENACEHNDSEAPRVWVNVRRIASRVHIEVADDGPGIPEQEWAVLDEGGETPLRHGSGIGLWIAYWAVEQSDGAIQFGDRDPTGAVVTISLPGRQPVPDADDVDLPDPSTFFAEVSPTPASPSDPPEG